MGFYSGLCGDKALNADQLEQFREFSKVMHQASVAFFSVSATNLILTFSEVSRCPLFRLGPSAASVGAVSVCEQVQVLEECAQPGCSALGSLPLQAAECLAD